MSANEGIDEEQQRAAILEIDAGHWGTAVYASGLRNPNGLAWEPQTGALWTVVNERDELGSDLVPDYLTSVVRGGFYGWPYSYFGAHVDERVEPPNPELVATARMPDYALGPHTASLGLLFYASDALPGYRGGAFVAQHGSWNRKPLVRLPCRCSFRSRRPAAGHAARRADRVPQRRRRCARAPRRSRRRRDGCAARRRRRRQTVWRVSGTAR